MNITLNRSTPRIAKFMNLVTSGRNKRRYAIVARKAA